MELKLTPRTFRCVWLLVVGLHLACAVFLTQLARVYRVIAHPYVENLAILVMEDGYQYLHHATVVVALVAVLHWWQLLNILWSTLRAKALVFESSSPSVANRKLAAFWSMRGASGCFRGPNRVAQLLAQGWRSVFGRSGVFGIESHLFRLVFTARELTEIVSQSFQARRSSELLPRPWLNHLLVAFVVTNCWSTPVVQHLLGHHQGLERVVCLFIDAMLNIGSGMVIPLAIFLPYYQALSPVTLTFPVELQYNSIWFSRLVMENRLLFSLAASDVLSKLILHLGVYTSLTSMVALIHRRRQQRMTTLAVQPRKLKPRHAALPAATSLNGSSRTDLKAKSNPGRDSQASATDRVLARVSRQRQTAVHLCFFVWGIALLSIHIRATVRYQQQVDGCSLTTASWFAARHPCSVYNYNCYRHGTTSPDESSWSHLESDTLLFFAITHCSELKMPRHFRSFRNLMLIQLHNATLVEWSKESAVSATQHPLLAVLGLTRTNLTRIPDGLLESLPDRLQNVQITHTNVTDLPPDLHIKWHGLMTLYLEHSLLREFPKVLLSLPIRELSLHGNLIETLPELTDIHQHFLSFVMSANPLVSLPDSLGDDTTFTFFSAERTLLAALPSWVHTSVRDAVYLYGTPYCAFQTTKEPTACAVRDNRVDGKSPTAVFDAKFPL